MANGHVLISSQTLSSAVASVTFGSGGTLSQAYRDLILVISGTAAAGGNVTIRFNGDAGANYTYVQMYGTGSAAQSASGSGWGGVLYTNQGMGVFQIMDYSASDKHKVTIGRSGAAGNLDDLSVDRWANTAAITSLVVSHSGGNYATGTTFYLYGVRS
jgi:hypothetical protein